MCHGHTSSCNIGCFPINLPDSYRNFSQYAIYFLWLHSFYLDWISVDNVILLQTKLIAIMVSICKIQYRQTRKWRYCSNSRILVHKCRGKDIDIRVRSHECYYFFFVHYALLTVVRCELINVFIYSHVFKLLSFSDTDENDWWLMLHSHIYCKNSLLMTGNPLASPMT